MYVACVKGKDPAAVKIHCPRCNWKGTAADEGVRLIDAPGARHPYCPKCDGPCSEIPFEPKEAAKT